MGKTNSLDKRGTECNNGSTAHFEREALSFGCNYGICNRNGRCVVEFEFEENIGYWFLVAGCWSLVPGRFLKLSRGLKEFIMV